LILATAVATGAAVAAAQAAAGTARLKSIPRCYIGKSAEEIAAIKIQTAYRGYLVWTFLFYHSDFIYLLADIFLICFFF
jgi:hypothetical protein